MTGFAEPQVVDPGTLEPGDQVGCSDAGPRLRPMVGDRHQEEPVWVTLGSAMAEALAQQGWSTTGLPRVLARRLLVAPARG